MATERWWCDDAHTTFIRCTSPRAVCVNPQSEFANKMERELRPVTMEEYYKYELYLD